MHELHATSWWRVKDGDGRDWAGWWPRMSLVQPTPSPNESAADDAKLQARGRTTGIGGARRRRPGRDSDGGGRERGAGACGGGAKEGIRQRDAGEKARMRDLRRVGGGGGLVLDLSPT
jgi:hypothetical protein